MQFCFLAIPPEKGLSSFEISSCYLCSAFHLKVAELIQTRSLHPYLPLFEKYIESVWQNWFSSSRSPNIDFASIESISGQAIAMVKPLKSTGENKALDHKHQLMLGGPRAIVRFKQDIPNWGEWIKTYIPEAKVVGSSKSPVIALPVMPAIGPEPARVMAYDDRTLIISTEDRLSTPMATMELRQGAPQWDKAWNTVDTGLLSVLVSSSGLEVSEKEDIDVEARAIAEVLEECDQVGLSLDLDDSSWLACLKVSFLCTNAESASKLKDALADLAKLKIDTVARELEALAKSTTAPHATDSLAMSRQEKLATMRQLKAFRQCKILEVNGKSIVEARMSFDYTFEDLFPHLIKQPHEIAKAPTGTTEK